MGFATEEKALELATDCGFGLRAAILTQDLSQAFRIFEGVEVGICWGEITLLAWPCIDSNNYIGRQF